MKIKRVEIKNFRKISDISLDISQNLAVIVGPNASGKSTIFEAVRLAKAILFPRMQDELRNVLVNLGATSAHFYNGQLNYDISTLANTPTESIFIALTIQLSTDELAKIDQARTTVARNLVAAQLGRSPDDPTFDLRAYFATALGQQAERSALEAVNTAFDRIKDGSPFKTIVEITHARINVSDTIINLFVALLENSLQPDKAILSYFPADRSMPSGEVALQIGPQDFKAQVDSHLAHAAAKYGRLKQTVVNHAILAGITGQSIKPEFDSIFDVFLPGKEFVGLTQKPTGLVAVQVRDRTSQKIFDIDSLSSGEKGLVLSFLLFRSSISPGSIILVDELELHLNPAVCRKIIPFLIDGIIEKTDCQFLISTHSAEILRDAYEREDCELFHLRSGTDISPVLRQDTRELLEAISRLGVSPEQALMSRTSLFVEGDSDAAILSAAFPGLLTGIQIRPLNGRSEIERSIKELQVAESNGTLKDCQAFLFDLDRSPSGLQESKFVKFEQLQRYCIENYLLDEIALFDLIEKHASRKPESRGEFRRSLKELALAQLDDVALQRLISPYRSIRPGLTNSEIRGRSVAEVALMQRDRLQQNLLNLQKFAETAESWEEKFKTDHAEIKLQLLHQWQEQWPDLCNGKLLFSQLQKNYQINMEMNQFKATLAKSISSEGKEPISTLRMMVERLISAQNASR